MFRNRFRVLLSRKIPDPYVTLGVRPNASKEEIKKAYRRLALLYHPDSGKEGSAEKFNAIQEAYEALKDGRPWAPRGEEPSAFRSHPSGFTYEPPGSTDKGYVSGDTEIFVKIFMYCCFLFVCVGLFTGRKSPSSTEALNRVPDDATSVHRNDEQQPSEWNVGTAKI